MRRHEEKRRGEASTVGINRRGDSLAAAKHKGKQKHKEKERKKRFAPNGMLLLRARTAAAAMCPKCFLLASVSHVPNKAIKGFAVGDRSRSRSSSSQQTCNYLSDTRQCNNNNSGNRKKNQMQYLNGSSRSRGLTRVS